MKLHIVELLMSLENHRGRMDRARTIDMLKQAEDAIRAAEQLKAELRKARRLLVSASRALPVDDRLAIDTVLVSSAKSIIAYCKVVPEREDEQETTPA